VQTGKLVSWGVKAMAAAGACAPGGGVTTDGDQAEGVVAKAVRKLAKRGSLVAVGEAHSEFGGVAKLAPAYALPSGE
jgi:hypothetical protein